MNEWTHEQVYRNPIEDPRRRAFKQGMPPRVPPHIRDEIKAGRPHPYTDAYVKALFEETEWEDVGEDLLPRYDENPQLLLNIGAGIEKCPACLGRRDRKVARRGKTTGVPSIAYRRCRCTFYVDRWRYISDPLLVPERYASARLPSLQPSDVSNMSLDHQKAVIAQLRAEPDRSYFFYGGAGTGKTHFASALYVAAVDTWAADCFKRDIPSLQCTFRFVTGAFLDSCVAYAMRGDREVSGPGLSPYNVLALAKRGYKVRLFLEEIDKFNPTEFKLGELAAIVDAVYSTNGQLVTTSNTSVEDLYAKWDSPHAHAILRRFVEGVDGMALCFGGKTEYTSHSFDPQTGRLTMQIMAYDGSTPQKTSAWSKPKGYLRSESQ